MTLRNLRRGPVSVYTLCDDRMLKGPFELPAISQTDVFGIVMGIDGELSAWVPETAIEEFIQQWIFNWKECDATMEQRRTKAEDVRKAAASIPAFRLAVRRIVIGTLN